MNTQSTFDQAVVSLDQAVVLLLQVHVTEGDITSPSFEPRGATIQGTAYFNGQHNVVKIVVTSPHEYSINLSTVVHNAPQLVANLQDAMNEYDRALSDL